MDSLSGNCSPVAFNSTVDGTNGTGHGDSALGELWLNVGYPEILDCLPVDNRVVLDDSWVGEDGLVVQVVGSSTVVVVPRELNVSSSMVQSVRTSGCHLGYTSTSDFFDEVEVSRFMSHVSHQNGEFFHTSRERCSESSGCIVVQVWLVNSTGGQGSVEVVFVD